MDYKAIIHSFIDPIITDPNDINIDIKEEERDITINILASNENISRLIGKHGKIANAIREAINIAGKEDNKFVHVHFDDKEKTNATSATPTTDAQ